MAETTSNQLPICLGIRNIYCRDNQKCDEKGSTRFGQKRRYNCRVNDPGSCRKLEKIAFAAHGEDVCFSPRNQMVTKSKMVHQGGREGGL